MVHSCSVIGCKNRFQKERNITFHRFPFKSDDLLRKWLQNIMRANFTPTPHSRICSDHFQEECFERGYLRRRLRDDAVPTVFPLHVVMVLPQKPPMKTKEEDMLTSKENIKTEHAYSQKPESLEKQLRKAKQQTEQLRKRLRSCQTTSKRQQNSIKRLKAVLRQSKREGTIDEDETRVTESDYSDLDSNLGIELSEGLSESDLEDCPSEAQGIRYPADARSFALDIDIYSPEFMRDHFSSSSHVT